MADICCRARADGRHGGGADVVAGDLPKDTSYAGRLYTATNGLQINSTIILMGADRTSIHKPDYCLPGQGWSINEKTVVNIPVAGPQNYQLPVAKWIVGNVYQTPDGQKHEVSGLYAVSYTHLRAHETR